VRIGRWDTYSMAVTELSELERMGAGVAMVGVIVPCGTGES
jgi:hypothetical protein